MQKNNAMAYFEKNGEEYKKKIIEMVSKTQNSELLELIHRFCKKLIG